MPSLRRAVIALLLRLTPARWRESVAGDFEEDEAGALAMLWHGSRLIARLWMEELAVARAMRRRPVMRTFALSLRHAARALVARPAYSLIVIATLAIGIGASAAVFTLANWLMLRPLPAVHDPASLVTIRFAVGFGNLTISHVEMRTLAAHAPALDGIAGSMESSFNLAAAPAPAERVEGAIVSPNYFDVLGVRLSAGRAFSASEPGVVISHGYWRSRLGGAGAVGQTVMVNGRPQPILGIAPPGFTGMSRSSAIAVWVPVTLRTQLFGARRDPLTEITSMAYIELFGRLKPGATIDDVTGPIDGARQTLMTMHPRPQRYERLRIEADAGVVDPAYPRTRLGSAFTLLMAMVALLLLLTCANVGNVVLAAGTSRRAEIATRQALGASRGQVVGGVILECVLLSLAGAAVAVAIAGAAGAMMRGTVVLPFLAALGDISIDWRVIAFAFAVSTLAAVAAGLLPALAATRVDLISTLKGTTRSVTGGSRRLRRAFLVAQVALSLTFLVGGLLLARSIQARRAVDPGFDASRLMTLSVEPGLHGFDGARLTTFYAELLEAMGTLPGVERAALSWNQAFGNRISDTDVRAIDAMQRDELRLEEYMVSEDYFAVMGIPLVAGRGLTRHDLPQDYEPGPRNVILSASAAERLFGSPAAALGRTLDPGYPEGARRDIVGVVADVRLRRAFEPPQPAMYERLDPETPFGTVHLRLAPGARPEDVAELARAAVRGIDPTLPPYDLMTVRDAMARQMTEEALVGRLTMAFALIATFLAAVGLYGVLAQSVSERRVEIGIRGALGAAPAQVLRMVTWDALRTTLAGAGAGVVLSLWLGRYIENRLFGVDRFDAAAFGAALAVMIATSVVAAAIPARRAARVDPVTALRQ